MDIHDLRELILDVECMTVLRHVMEQPALAALYRLVCDCADENVSEGELTYAYCEVYNAWLRETAAGRAAVRAHRCRAAALQRDQRALP